MANIWCPTHLAVLDVGFAVADAPQHARAWHLALSARAQHHNHTLPPTQKLNYSAQRVVHVAQSLRPTLATDPARNTRNARLSPERLDVQELVAVVPETVSVVEETAIAYVRQAPRGYPAMVPGGSTGGGRLWSVAGPRDEQSHR